MRPEWEQKVSLSPDECSNKVTFEWNIKSFFFLNGHLESRGSGLNDTLQKDGKKTSLTEQEAAVLQDETFILQLTIKTSAEPEIYS